MAMTSRMGHRLRVRIRYRTDIFQQIVRVDTEDTAEACELIRAERQGPFLRQRQERL